MERESHAIKEHPERAYRKKKSTRKGHTEKKRV